MDKKLLILIWLMVGSLFLNFYTFFRIGNLEAEIKNINNNIINSSNFFSHQFDYLSSNVNRKPENNWIKYIEYIPNEEKSTPSEIHLFIQWSFQEIDRDAEISFYYKTVNDDNWIKANIEEKEEVTYIAETILSEDKNYEFKIVANGSSIRTSDIYSIPSNYYQLSPLVMTEMSTTSGNGLTHISAQFAQKEPVIFDFYEVKSANAKIYQDSELVRVVELTPIESGRNEIGFKTDIKGVSNSIVLEVEYKNGITHKGEIYPNDEYTNNIIKYLK